MAARKVTVGVIAPVKVKPEHVDDFAAFVPQLVEPAKNELGTVHWFGTKLGDGNVFGFVDTFIDEDSRKAHMTGEIVKLVLSKKDWFEEAPVIKDLDILAAKETKKDMVGVSKAGVEVGLRVVLKAKADKITAVRDFLISAVPLVDAEPATIHWTAVQHPNTNIFEIIDSFPDEAGRNAHLNGKVAEALFANVDTLLDSAPEVTMVTILAGNINH